MSKNDEKILELKKQIKEKRNSIGKAVRFTPETNCILSLNGANNNINVLGKDALTLLLVQLNTYVIAADDIDVDLQDLKISGYEISEWMNDIKSRLSAIQYKEESDKLKVMESKLDKLLSNDKKTELEIDEIAELLK